MRRSRLATLRPARPATLCALILLAATAAAAPAAAQQPHAPERVTAEDYARAERHLAPTMNALMVGGAVSPVWLEDGRFWYRRRLAGGGEYMLVDPARRSVDRLFDHPRLARALSAAADTALPPEALPVREVAADARSVQFQIGAGRFTCDIRSYRCVPAEATDPARTVVVSPDGRRGAFVRDHDLWVRDLDTGAETRLTHDGREDFGYATNNAGWVRSDRPVVTWSPDSRKLATFQHDSRGVGRMTLTTTNVGHPRVDTWRYPLPEDTVIFRIHRVIIDLEADGGPRVVRFRMPPDPHRSTVCDHVVCGGEWADVQWLPDASGMAFVSSSRDHKVATLRLADAATGEVRDVLEERVESFYESGHRQANWQVLPESREAIWFSRQSDWGHLYLHDLDTGALKRQITRGDWNVLQVARVDPDARTIWFIGNEREPGDPYFQYLYRVGMDDGVVTLLTPDSANHDVGLSPDGRFIVDTYSTPTTPSITVLRDARTGERLMEVERGDISGLVEAGWQAPIPFSVKARDGVTDLHGLMYRPSSFDPSRRYPIINHIYPGPQSGSVGSRSFVPARGDAQALAELGFVVVQLDAMGTPMRSRSFHEAYYGNMGDNGLPDQVGGMRQLAERHPWIDLDRAGIYGHSGGGFASTRAILAYPEFFRVAVSQAGNHDNRNYEDDWGEKWQGLLEVYPDGSTNYDNQANQLLAGNLQGKLLLAHGTMDDNVPFYSTLLVVDALIAANKDFDLIMFPNRRHGFGNEPYMMRRRWDYFVRHLLGAEPPREFVFGTER